MCVVCCVCCVHRCDSEKRVYSETKNNNNNKNAQKILSFFKKKIVYNYYMWKMENGVMRSCGRQIEKENCFFLNDVLAVVIIDATASRWLNSGWILLFLLLGCCFSWMLWYIFSWMWQPSVDTDRTCSHLPQAGWVATWWYTIFIDHLSGTVQCWNGRIDFGCGTFISFTSNRIAIWGEENDNERLENDYENHLSKK